MDELRKQVGRAQRRLGLQRFVDVLGWCLCATLLLAIALVVTNRYWPLGVEPWAWPVAAVVLGFIAAALWTVLRSRGPVDAAIEIDRRFGLKERVSSSLAMSEEERQTEIGRALLEDAARRVARIDVREHFKLSPRRRLLLPLLPAALAVAVLLWPATPEAEGKTDVEAAKKQIETVSKSLQLKLAEKREQAKQQGLKDAQKLLLKLQEELDKAEPKLAEDKRERMVQLNDLAKEVEKRSQELGGAEAVQKQLEQLRNMDQGPAEKFAQALAKGDLKKAQDELQKLQDKLAKGELTEKERKELTKQMEQMRQNLEKMLNAHRDAMKDLEKRINELRQQGKNDEANKLQEKLTQLQAQLPQMNQLKQMGDKLGKCAQCMKDGQLKEAAEALQGMQAELQNMQQQLQDFKLMQEAMDQLDQARRQMMCNDCGGKGCKKCRAGQGLGEGQGDGERPQEENKTDFFNTQARTKARPGAGDVMGQVEGPNEKGDVLVEMASGTAPSGAGEAADPLTDLRAPRKHRDNAKEYFDYYNRPGENKK